MIKSIVLLSCLLVIIHFSSAQNSFEKVYGGALPEVFRSVLETSDGSLLAGGSTRSFGSGDIFNTDFYLVKTKANGDTLWTRAFGTTYNDDATAVAEFANGYVIAGTSINPANGSNDFFVVKTDKNGNITWSNYYGGNGAEYCTHVVSLSDTTLLIYGTTTSYTSGGYDLYMVKLDTSGSQLAAFNFGGTGNDSGYGIHRTDDGGYIMSGFSSSGLSSADIYLLKLDSSFVLQWSRTFGGTGLDIGYDVEQTPNGGYMVLGLWQNGPDSSEIVLIETDSNGLDPVIKYPGTHPGDYGYAIRRIADGYLLSGATFYPGKGSEMLLIKTDLNGDTLWSRHYGGMKNEAAISSCAAGNGDVILAGETEGFGIDNFDSYLIRVNASGDIPCPDEVSFITGDSALCEDQTDVFTNTTVSSQQFDWTIDGNSFSGDINAAWYFNSSGSYNISLSVCSVTDSQTVEIFPKPPSHFTYSIDGTTTSFALPPGFSFVSLNWNFGDGSPENTVDTNPVHTYSTPGYYWVVLDAKNANGCDSTYVEQINVITGISDPVEQVFSISPNPVHQSGKIILNENNELPAEATIYDLSGKKISQFTMLKSTQEFSVAEMDPGFYIIGIRPDKSSTGACSFVKLIVQ